MSIMEGLRAYFMQCPLLDAGSRLGVDFLGTDAVEYVVESVPAEAVLQAYTDGASKRQFVFMFASREAYGSDVLQNLANSGFYESLADWMEEQSGNNRFPAMPEEKMPLKIEAQTSGYLMDAGPEAGRYQIQCRLIYYQED